MAVQSEQIEKRGVIVCFTIVQTEQTAQLGFQSQRLIPRAAQHCDVVL